MSATDFQKRIKNECRDEIINDLNEFEDIANDVLRENGFSYTAHAEYGKFEFPEKTYKSMILPAGRILRCKDCSRQR